MANRRKRSKIDKGQELNKNFEAMQGITPMKQVCSGAHRSVNPVKWAVLTVNLQYLNDNLYEFDVKRDLCCDIII